MTGTQVVVGGALLSAIVGAALVQAAKKKKDNENLLESCFGKPMVTNTFTMNEAKTWIMQRKDSLENDGKALITTLDQENLQKFGIEIQLKESVVIKNYLLLAIIDSKQGKISESVLIKYEMLDQTLKTALDKGNGSMVVTA